MRSRIALAAVAIALAVPAGAAGDDEDDENESATRVFCVGGSAVLRLQTEDDDDDGIAVALRVSVPQPVFGWRLVLLHERRLVYQGLRASTREGYYMRYERRVPDWRGSQTVVARLTTAEGRACRLEATI
jgi:hypothetical protein